jgi:hypothetical protein
MAPSLLDAVQPEYDFSEHHETVVRASPERTFAALRELRPQDLPLTALLMGIRGLPGIISRRTGLGELRKPVIDRLREAGFTLLRETEREVVFGVVGRFWELRTSRPQEIADARAYIAFDRPGFAKAAWNFQARRVGGRTRLSTETRIKTTDPEARRLFGRYWRVVMPGSALIRREMLWAIRRRAERDGSSAASRAPA